VLVAANPWSCSFDQIGILRGRKAVRADRRLRADEKHIRTQSAILYNSPRTVLVFNNNRDFCADTLFIRTENTVGARSAQIHSSHAKVFETS